MAAAGSADGRAWSAVMPLSCPGQVRSRVQLVPLLQCLNGQQEGGNWWRSLVPLHQGTDWERICWCQWGGLGHPSMMVQGEHGQALVLQRSIPSMNTPSPAAESCRVSAHHGCTARGLQIFPPLSALGVGLRTDVFPGELLCVASSSSALVFIPSVPASPPPPA